MPRCQVPLERGPGPRLRVTHLLSARDLVSTPGGPIPVFSSFVFAGVCIYTYCPARKISVLEYLEFAIRVPEARLVPIEERG